MASERCETYICKYCGKTRTKTNKSKHMKQKHPVEISKQTHRLIAPFVDKVSSDSLREKLSEIDWKSLDTLTKDDLALWKQSTTCPPRRFGSKDCWYPDAPSYDALFESMFAIIEGSTSEDRNYSVYENGGKKGRAARAVRQSLGSPDPEHPTYICNLDPEVGDRALDLPPEDRYVMLRSKLSHLHANLATVYSFMDLQINRGADTLASGIEYKEDARFAWFIFPPTEANLEIYFSRKYNSQGAPQQWLFLVCALELEGGLVIQTTADQVLHLPSGTLYAVLTIKSGGFLTFQSKLSAESLVLMAKYITFAWKAHNSQESELVSALEIYLDCLQAALETSRKDQVDFAVKSWLVCNEILKEKMAVGSLFIASFPALKKKIDAIWEDNSILATLSVFLPSLNLDNCCGIGAGEDIFEHFQNCHLL